MTEFNKNYLGHEFTSLNSLAYPFDFICNKCNSRIKHDINDKNNLYSIANDGKIYPNKIISCDEMIIKNIIE